MTRAARGWLWLLTLSLAACASTHSTPARVRVELLRGFDAAPAAAESRVTMLIDVTRSMAATTRAGPRRDTVAREAARRLVTGLPDDAVVSLHALGAARGACADPVRQADVQVGLNRFALFERIGALPIRGEGSLASALRALAADGDASGRVVAFSDLGRECGGDLCAAATQFAARGVRLDLVVIGDAPIPDCLRDIAVLPDEAPAAAPFVPVRRHFHVASALGGGQTIRVCGEADAEPVTILPGRGTLELELEPPLRIERSFPPGADLVLQVIEFPALDPPVRKWRWQHFSGGTQGGEAGER